MFRKYYGENPWKFISKLNFDSLSQSPHCWQTLHSEKWYIYEKPKNVEEWNTYDNETHIFIKDDCISLKSAKAHYPKIHSRQVIWVWMRATTKYFRCMFRFRLWMHWNFHLVKHNTGISGCFSGRWRFIFLELRSVRDTYRNSLLLKLLFFNISFWQQFPSHILFIFFLTALIGLY